MNSGAMSASVKSIFSHRAPAQHEPTTNDVDNDDVM